MAEKTPPSIYDLDFAVLDEKKYSKVVSPVSPAEMAAQVEEVSTELVGRVALSTETSGVASPTPISNEQIEVRVDIPRPVESPPPYVSPETLELAQTAVDSLLGRTTKGIVPITMFVDTAFPNRPTKQDYEDFKNALQQDPRLEYLGSRDFQVVSDEATEPYWPGENPHIDMEKAAELAERIIKGIVETGLGKVFSWQLLERVRDDYLNSDESNELLALVASNPEISSFKDGGFSARLSDEELKNLIEERGTLSLDFDRKPDAPDKPITSSQIGRTMKKINRSYAVRKAADLAKRKANPRRRGKRTTKKLQGRVHNKAQRQQKLIARMMESNPPAAVTNSVTKVEVPDIDSIEVDSLLEAPREANEPTVEPQAAVLEKAQQAEPLNVIDYETFVALLDTGGALSVEDSVRVPERQRRPRHSNLLDYVAFAKRQFGDFQDLALLRRAFTHRSYPNEHKEVLEDNERLEFLGDAVLYLAVADHLYKNYLEPEGILTQWRTALVRNAVISAVAEQEGFEKLIRFGRSLKGDNNLQMKQQVLANCYEAVLGALYLTKGVDEVKAFVNRTLMPVLDEIIANEFWKDPKTHLQMLIQKNGNPPPEYRLSHEEGPDHTKVFVVSIYINDELIAEGAGGSQKAAQKEAATNALASLSTQGGAPG